MTGEWKPIERLRAHQHVVRQIEERLVEGSLKPGDRLPAERDLAQMLGVSRGAVREGLRALEALGILVSQPGSGPESGSIIASNPTEAMTLFLRLHVALSNFSTAEVVRTRMLLEGWAAAAAATNANEIDLGRARAIVTRMGTALEPETFNQLDTQFHVCIAEASGNRLLALFMQSLRDAIDRNMVDAFRRLDNWPAVATRLVAEHTELLRLVTAGDAVGARNAVEMHIRDFYGYAG